MNSSASAGNEAPARVSGPFCAEAQVSYTRRTASKSSAVARRIVVDSAGLIAVRRDVATSTVS
jgi:hypothetical protein